MIRSSYIFYPFYLLFSYFIFFKSTSLYAEFWRAMALMKVGKTIKIPKRQFLGMAPEVEKEVTKIIEDELEEYFNHLKF